ncbi:nuclear transport factor 2 family protein [Gramella sp. GC03-9]|uniref:Nuclear transport factor 2 family protein n=1 Tax=Christiangramia oceanisediminis TaxID=2920386 RepID=A0A9X2KWF3_9FLAO|nr:nuclear transport factor 2 family protein [Gramella oceanisediminis]MCP9199830.1 nuclear transport factor 2 family protein [Gramella oceanisediminis]
MKKLFVLGLIFLNISAFAQSEPESLVKEFFRSFHAQDTVALKSYAQPGTRMETASINEQGKVQFSSMDYSQFLERIASIPADSEFEEVLHEYRVEKNGVLATVTTPYSFYFNGNLSHCGVNSFQMVQFDDTWKITYVIDTRTKKDCKE